MAFHACTLHVSRIFNNHFCAASVNTLAFVSIDRYFAIVDPLRYVSKVTSTFITICITYCWIEAIWLAMMPIAGWSHYEYIPSEYICTVDWARYSYTIFLLGYNLGIPVLIVLYCYARIFKVARDQSRKVAEQTVQVSGAGKPAAKKETKAARILFIVIGTFLTCWMPHSVTMLCNAYTQNHCPIPEAYHTLTVLLAHTNSAMNPILYGALNRQMRRAYWNILTFLCRRSRGGGVDFSLTDYSM
ncbi:histamine H2 receptor-like [Amphiura filiformis]|uniref:histamine H2 receptor-like n=1 Tax=Amphiura filiformis TaxID=82378 RepID=UPI003B21C0E4